MVQIRIYIDEEVEQRLTHMEDLLMALSTQEQQRFDSINSRIIKLGSDIPSALSKLQSSADDLADQVADLHDQMTNLTTADQQQITDLKQQVADLESAAADHAAEVDTALSAVDTALGGLDEAVPEQAVLTPPTTTDTTAPADTTAPQVGEGELKDPTAPSNPPTTDVTPSPDEI